MPIIKPLVIFIIAGLCEIGGGYLIWLWLKENRPWWVGLLGAAVLILYGLVATLQLSNFGRVYAAYGGVFVVMALVWGWRVDKIAPDKYDLIGAVLALAGMLIIFFAPRK